MSQAPTVAAPLVNRSSPQGRYFEFRLPAGSFADADPGDAITLSARLADGSALPDWLRFDVATGSFSGSAPLSWATSTIDIRVTATDSTALTVSDDFSFKLRAPSAALFVATHPDSGSELWITDGTSSGTALLKDIRPGTGDGAPYGFTPLGNGKTIFAADDGSNGYELWVTDGTSDGTVMLRDLHTGAGSSDPLSFTLLPDGRVLLSADDGINGRELWVTDGVTAQFVDIVLGADGSSPEGFTPLGNGRAVFSAENGASGRELWITDGTSGGTTLVRDINPLSDGSYPEAFASLGNGKVLLSADDGINGKELWVTDGTPGGTMLVSDTYVGWDSGSPYAITPIQAGRALFVANDGLNSFVLWTTDGTAAGTARLIDAVPGADYSYPESLTPLGNGKTLFVASDDVAGAELWVTDGSSAGTVRVKDIWTGIDSGLPSPSSLLAIGAGKAVFSATDGSSGYEVWITDGSFAGTQILADIASGSASSFPSDFALLGGGRVLFSADDGVDGRELWITDGTPAGTVLARNIHPTAFQGSDAGQITAAFFNAAPTGSPAATLSGGTEDTVYTVAKADLLTGFIDADGDTLDVVSLSVGALGSVVVNGDGTFSITPNPDYFGTLTVTYAVVDGLGGSRGASVDFTLTSVNDEPVTNVAALTIAEGQTVTLGAADFGVVDPDNSEFTFTVSDLSGGFFQLGTAAGTPVTSFTSAQLAAGQVQFVDDGNEAAPAFSITANDGAIDSNTLAAAINYTALNDAPVLATATLALNEGDTVTLGSANFGVLDPDDTSFSFTITGLNGGIFQLSTAPGTPITGFTTADLTSGVVQFVDDGDSIAPGFSVNVDDGDVDSNVLAASISFSGTNSAPVFVAAGLTIAEGQTVTLGAADLGVVDPDNSEFTFTVSGLSGGFFQLGTAAGTPVTSFTSAQLAAGQVQFVDDGNEAAPAFSITANDGAIDSNTLAAAINYTALNDAPTGSASAILPTGTEDMAYPVAAAVLLQGFGDPDGDALNVSNLVADRGVATGAGASFAITPPANYSGTIVLSYDVIDGNGGSVGASRSFTLAEVNDSPTAQPDTATTRAGVAVTLAVRGNDGDIDGDALTVTSVSQPADGNVVISGATGNPVYTPPAAPWSGTATFTYTISDGRGGTASAAVVITVTEASPANVINGTEAANTLTGTDSDDLINGRGGNDTINGGGGNDTIDGGTGSDSMRGGPGNDTYIVERAADGVVENADAGVDLVQSSVTYVLPGNVENLALTSAGAISGTGNELANTIVGNDAANMLRGKAGPDLLFGNGGSDIFRVAGSELNGDAVDGGSGADTLEFSANVTLGAARFVMSGVETLDMRGFGLTVQGTAAVDLSSLQLVNRGLLLGDSAANNITGTTGNDNMDGGGGNDVLRGGAGNDQVSGGGGKDTIFGGPGADWIAGGIGSDTLYGGADTSGVDGFSDTFVFNAALGSGHTDRVIGFEADGIDKIGLASALFGAVTGGPTSGLDAGEFRASVGGTPGDANDYILFDTATGTLSYDADGSGSVSGKIAFALLIGTTGSLDASDFVVNPPPPGP